MAVIQEFLVGLGFKVDQNSFNKFNQGLKKAAVAASAVGVAATAAAGLVSKFVTDTANGFNRIGLLSERVNASAKDISQLGFVASLTGSSVEAVTGSLDRFNRTAGEAALGIGRGATAFKELGLSVRNGNGHLKDTAQLMDEVGKKIRNMTSQKKVAVLERLGIDPTLVKALSSDVSGLKNEFNAIYKGAGINANEAAKSSVAFIDSLTRMKFAFKTVKDAVALKLMPEIKDGIDSLRKFIIQNAPKIIKAALPIVDLLLRIGKIFVAVVFKIGIIVGKIIDWFDKLNSATNGWAGAILAAAAAWKFLNLSFLASPIGIILSMIAAVGLLIDDFVTFKNGGESLIDWGGRFGTAMKVVTTIINGVVGAVKLLIQAGAVLIASWEKVQEWFTGFFDWMISKFENLAKISEKLWGLVQNLFGGSSSQNAPILTPTARVASTLQQQSNNNQNSINQKTEITVNGVDSAAATAFAIASQQNRVNADLARNLSGVTR